ncbi:AB hydrolase superfamily protein YvaM [Aquisphaera giovannonii]|uniref:AB hydrolase superfamily protein YvaM n=1 Tax=Aquisphaera giovannonii TaxID=406548 RepID=A0A5B9VXG4_9BACT|nr:alpha/beta hydrolase [Aquisphaera giovannonii]QEH32390.1 AB hydrolase superfamily protein YvaM [Aquisphaera giovannonii]
MRLAARWQDALSTSLSIPGGEGVRRTQVRLGGERVEVVRLGRGEPLVMVPGLAGSWRLLLPLARRLARRYEVITYGLRDEGVPGFGIGGLRSGLWDIGGHADDVASLIDQLGLESPTVLGVSFGGVIALQAAVDHPRSVGALIVHGAEAKFHATIGSKIARRVLERFPLPTDNRFVNQFFNLLHGAKPEPGPLVDFVVERIWETDQSVMARRLAQLEGFDVSDQLWKVEAPTLVLAGAKDVIVPAARQRRLAEGIAGARFEALEGAGHIGFLTHRREFARQVVKHLREVKAAV